MRLKSILGTAVAVSFTLSPAIAKSKNEVTLGTCESNLGSIAVVEGDTQGWSKYGLGSPRELIATLARESGCFTLHNPASGTSATFLMNVIAGDQEEVDQGMEVARGAAIQGLVHSGAAGQVLGRVPFGGAMMGMFGGFGGKKKTVAAGIRVISPSNGMTVALGSGSVRKSTLSFGGMGNAWVQGAQSAGYGTSNDGKMLTEAFVIAFNSVIDQQTALTSVAASTPAPASATASNEAEVAIDTKMYSLPDLAAESVRNVRAGTKLTPTGKREGLFIEANDGFGTVGWISVEDLI